MSIDETQFLKNAMSQSSSAEVRRFRQALLICPNGQIASELLPHLSRVLPITPVVELRVLPSEAELLKLLDSHRPDLCFLDVSSDQERALALLSRISLGRGHVPVVTLLADNNPDMILSCLRQGASEFLLAPFTVEQVQAMAKKLGRLHRNPSEAWRRVGKVYCVMPGKGDSGATTIAHNLAYQWKRLGAQRVLLADMDTLAGTISFSLKLKSSYSFMDAIAHSSALDADLWKVLVTSSQGVDILLSPEESINEDMEKGDPAAIVEYARNTYDVVILDSGGPYGDWNLALARLCDEILLVTSNDLLALYATQRLLTYLDRNGVERSKIRLLLSQFKEMGLDEESVETALHLQILGTVPADTEEVRKALMNGKAAAASSRLGKSIAALAEQLAGQEAPPPKQSAWGRLLSKCTLISA